MAHCAISMRMVVVGVPIRATCLIIARKFYKWHIVLSLCVWWLWPEPQMSVMLGIRTVMDE